MHVSLHLALGAVVGSLTGNPADGLAAGVASHVILDALPHWDYSGVAGGVVDLAVAAALTCTLVLAREPACVLMGAAGGTLPDVEVLRSYLRPGRPLIFPSHSGALPHGRAASWWASLPAAVVAAAALAFLLTAARAG